MREDGGGSYGIIVINGSIYLNIMNKPKVLFIGPYPPPYAGPELGMKLFLESQLRDVFDIYFLKTNFRKTNVNKGHFDFAMIMAFFRFIFILIWKIIQHRPAVAYYPITPVQIGWIGRDIWCLVICRLFKIKTIIHLRGSHLSLNLQKFNPLVRQLVYLTCRTVSLALVQAECLKDQFKGLVPDNRIAVLYNAIETVEYSNDTLNDYDSNIVLFMGHLTQAKGYCDLVSAIPLVVNILPNVRFVFAGTLRRGERGVFFNQITGSPLVYQDPFIVHSSMQEGPYKEHYLYLGLITGKEKIQWIKKSNIFILPSYSEGFSRSLLECMSMGKPVVCTPVGAHKEVIKDGINGFIVTPGDINQLADKIIGLLTEQPLRNRMAEENYRYVRDKFDSQIIIFQMEKYIKRVINEHH